MTVPLGAPGSPNDPILAAAFWTGIGALSITARDSFHGMAVHQLRQDPPDASDARPVRTIC